MNETFLGIPAGVVDLAAATHRVSLLLATPGPHLVASVNPEICMAAQKNTELRRILTGAALGIPDGIGIVLASRLRRGQIKSRVTGIDLMQELVALAASQGQSIYLFGAARGVAQAAAANLQARHPSLKIAGTHHGYVSPAEEEEVARKIAASGADLVFVGLGSPRQEYFVSRHGAITGARVLMVVGGSFDVLSGRLCRAPRIYQRLGLEWAFRLLQQPKRYRRFFVLPKFLLLSIIKKN